MVSLAGAVCPSPVTVDVRVAAVWGVPFLLPPRATLQAHLQNSKNNLVFF